MNILNFIKNNYNEMNKSTSVKNNYGNFVYNVIFFYTIIIPIYTPFSLKM